MHELRGRGSEPITQQAENEPPPLPRDAKYSWEASGRLLDEDDKLITVSARAVDRLRLCVGTLNAAGIMPPTENLPAAYDATRTALLEQCSPANGLLSLVPPFADGLRTAEQPILVRWKTARIMATIAEIAWGRGIINRLPLVVEAMAEMRAAVSHLDSAREIETTTAIVELPRVEPHDDAHDRMSQEEWLLVDGVLRAISEIPGVHGLVVAHLLGGGWTEPAVDIASLKLRADR